MAWYDRLANVFRMTRLDRDLDREIKFHLRERIDDLQAKGWDGAEARQRARRQFGNPTLQKERTRDMNLALWLYSTVRNLRLGVRSLARTRTLSAAVIVTLALGIGANSAVFSAIDAILLRPLPFPNGDQLMHLNQRNTKNPDTFAAPVRVEDWNRMNATFQAITGYYTEDVSESSGELPEKVRRASVAPRFLQVWGVAPALGRDFAPEEEHFGGPNAILISDRLWRRRYGADSAAVGQRLRFGDLSPTIVGVMPASFLFPDLDVDVWWAVPPDAPVSRVRNATWFSTIGRMKPNVSLEHARADLASVQARLAQQFPDTDAGLWVDIQPLKEETIVGVRRSLWIVFGSVSLLLLIACANIAALLLARAIQRQQEISVRFALGASRASIASQMLTETAILALCGASLGLLIAMGAPRVFRALAGNMPRMQEVQLDWRIAGYTFVCALAVTFLCGLIPAIRSTRRDVSSAIAQSGRSHVSGRHSLQWTLVGVQVALAVTLLAGAGLLLRSFQALGRVSPGFEVNHILTFHISGSWAETADYPGLIRRMDGTLDFLRTIPGVEASATTAFLPGVPLPVMPLELTLADDAQKAVTSVRFVAPSYFATLRIPVLAGEACPQRQGARATIADVLVNRSFADRYLGGSPGLGRRFLAQGSLRPSEIRGLVGDAREQGLHRAAAPTVYFCGSAPSPMAYFLVRTSGDPRAMIQTIRKEIHKLEPNRSVFDFTPFEDQLGEAYSENRLRTILLGVFAVTAVLLACIGLYSTLSYLVTVRRREVGLRLALGAEPAAIVRHFLSQGVRVTMAACLVGLVLALSFTRLLAGMLYGVSPSDPATLSSVIFIVVAIGSVASLVPAFRASRVDPMQVLRDE